MSLEAATDAEKSFWDAYYNINTAAGDSDWYSRLKSAAINMLALHDFDNGTGFTANWPSGSANDPVPQNTRLGKESVICQKCHADNVIAVVKSAYMNGDPAQVIKPISEAIHHRHREVSEGGSIDFADAAGRSGGCQGCHPAHRSDGVMDGYPITREGENFQALSDNRLAAGGCFVGRDVHSNPMKDVDGAETPSAPECGGYVAGGQCVLQPGRGGRSVRYTDARVVVHQLSYPAGSGDMEGRGLQQPDHGRLSGEPARCFHAGGGGECRGCEPGTGDRLAGSDQ